MSRVRHSLRHATAAVGIALALAGCSAGQISQTAGMEAAVNGGEGDVGPVAVRDIQLAYPPHGVYEPGSAAVVLGTIANSAQTDDELISITSRAGQAAITGDKNLPAGRSLVLEVPVGGVPTSSSRPTTTSSTPPSGTPTSGAPTSGGATTTSGSTSASTPGSTSGSASTSTTTTTPRPTTTTTRPVTIGKVTVILTGIAEELRSGQTIELTFTFRGGSVTIPVPIAVPTTPRQPAAGGGGH